MLPVANPQLIAEAKEQAWAAYHLNWPQRLPGGPWVSEAMTWKESIDGIASPFKDTPAEERLKLARHQNIVRAQARDAFNAGATWEAIRASLARDDPAFVPRDLKEHYRL